MSESHLVNGTNGLSRLLPGLRAVWKWAPLLVWCCLIFGLSQDSQSGSTSRALLLFLFGPSVLAPEILEPAQYVIRKAAHCFEFTVLALLAWRAFGGRLVIAWAFAFFFACVDELHQVFVPGRSGDWKDVYVDSCGALLSRVVCFFPSLRALLLWGTGVSPGTRQ